MAGKVKVGDEVVTKAGRLFAESSIPAIESDANPYVSRGGIKLAHALTEFQISASGKTALDIGASTGGFTDCLLQNGAEKILSVDVGYGQLDWKLQSDSRVKALDRQNARHLNLETIGSHVDLAVIDVSFISLKLVLPPVIELIKPEGSIIALIKPQFEVGKEEVENKGIIRDPEKHANVLLDLRKFVEAIGWPVKNLTPSPITGQKGNCEFLMHCSKFGDSLVLDEKKIRAIVYQMPMGLKLL